MKWNMMSIKFLPSHIIKNKKSVSSSSFRCTNITLRENFKKVTPDERSNKKGFWSSVCWIDKFDFLTHTRANTFNGRLSSSTKGKTPLTKEIKIFRFFRFSWIFCSFVFQIDRFGTFSRKNALKTSFVLFVFFVFLCSFSFFVRDVFPLSSSTDTNSFWPLRVLCAI
jgi:hypothetical protein